MSGISTEGEVKSLLTSFEVNCAAVHENAANIILNHPVPILNTLRDATASKFYSALCRLRHWFGRRKITLERCICLILLTDYISCTYANGNFYTMFSHSPSSKLFGVIVQRLSDEWKIILNYNVFKVLSEQKFIYLLRSLKKATTRLPCGVILTNMLTELIVMGEATYENYLLKAVCGNELIENDIKEESENCHKKIQNTELKPKQAVLSSQQHNSLNKSTLVHKDENGNAEVTPSTDTVNPSELGISSPSSINEMQPVKKKKCVTNIARYTVSLTKLKKCDDEIVPVMEEKDNLTVTNSESNGIDLISDKNTEFSPVLTSVENNCIKKLNAFDILMKRTSLKRKSIN